MWAYHNAAEELLSGTVTMDFVYEATGRLILGTRPILTTGSRTVTSMKGGVCAVAESGVRGC